VFSAYAILVRLAYSSAVAASLCIGTWTLVSISKAQQPWLFLLPLTIAELAWDSLFIACVICAMRAMFRPLRRISFLPEGHLRERPVVGTLVALSAAFASFLVFNVVLAFLQTWPDTGDVNFGGPIILALVLYAVSLLTGEIALVGRIARNAR
jgi:hypothetical protein